jgi:hypothetical protein
MCWRDLDVCLLAGVEFSPSDVLELLKRVVELRMAEAGSVPTTNTHPYNL